MIYRWFFVLSAAFVLPGAVLAQKAEIGETTVMFTTFDGATLPLPKSDRDNLSGALGSYCNGASEALVESGLGGGLVGLVLDYVFTEIRDGQDKRNADLTRTYTANKNVASFSVPMRGRHCLAIARLQVDADKRIQGYYSLVVLSLERETQTAFVVRPLYLHTPVLKTRTQSGEPPAAAAAISVSFSFIDPARGEQVYRREFSVPDYHVGPNAAPVVFAHAPKPTAQGHYEDFEDSAYLPYLAGRPVSIALAISETGDGADRPGFLMRLFRLNRTALDDRLKQNVP